MDITQRAKLLLYFMYLFFALILIGLPVAAYVLYQQNTYPDETLTLADYSYPAQPAHCDASQKTGAGGVSNNQHTAKGFAFHVRTPNNYNSTYAHPLLMVFTPSVSGRIMEKYTGLTRAATAAGFIIAYVDGQRLNMATIKEMGQIPGEIIKNWCIDTQRVFFTGHSDGGTLSSALAFLPDTPFHPTAIAPSAAGITGEELKQYDCPSLLSVMVMHNAGDTHFPGFGAQTAAWWAQCNHCDSTPQAGTEKNCVRYPNCAQGVETLYCEGQGGSHLTWPGINETLIDFFVRSPSKPKDG